MRMKGRKKLCDPLRISEMEEREHEVNLLLLEDKHYVLINDFSRLLTSQMTNHTEKKVFLFEMFKFCHNKSSVEQTSRILWET